MKQIFDGEVYEILPLNNGIIFSYCKDIIDQKVVVAFKMLSFETGRFTDIAKNIYLLTKFGNNYKAVVENCENYITVKSIILPNSKVFLLSQNGEVQLIDTDGTPIWKGSLNYRGFTPSDIVPYNNSLWACYGEINSIVRYNLSTMREELRIGGNKSPFCGPKSLFIEGNCVTVSNFGSKNLTEVNLDSYITLDREEFEEPVKQYVKADKYRFVLLQSGVYML